MMIRLIRHIAAFILLFNILALIWVLIYGMVPIPITKLMVIESQKKGIDYQWRSLDEISDKLELAVMCSEDQRFILHNGLDYEAIQQAAKYNERRGKSLRGASTISQQVAKNVFLWPDRSWIRKSAEVYFVLLIEALWSKQRIMEVYLNTAEMGDGIFGAEAAAKNYFNGTAKNLTTSQSAKLAVILPNPRNYSPINQTSYLKERTQWVKQQMRYWGFEMTYDPEEVLRITGD